MSKNKYAITDELWSRIQACLPPRNNTHPRGGGRKPKDDRLVFESILFVLRLECNWDTLNAARLCPSSTVHDRFRKWLREGFFHRLAREGLLDTYATRDIDWSWLDGDEAAAEAVGTGRPARGRSAQPRRGRRKRVQTNGYKHAHQTERRSGD